jgi:quercetin dioxygenase-like cupin family protein
MLNRVWLTVLMLSFATAAMAQQPARPTLVLKEIVAGMPKSDKQEVQILRASFSPGQSTVFHSHRFPVTVYVLEGAFTLELEGAAPITVTAGHAMVEPPNVRMTGYNRSASEKLEVLIVYVGDPGTPFLDALAH